MKDKYLRFAFLGWLSGMAGGLLLMTPQAWIASLGGDIWLIGMLSIWSLPYAMKPILAIFLDGLRNRHAWSYSELINGLIVLLAILIVLLGGVNPISQKMYFSLLLSMGCALASMLDTCIDGARIQLDAPGEQEMVAGYYTSGYRVGIIGASGLGLVLAKYYGWLLLYQGAGAVMFTGWWLVKVTSGKEDAESGEHALVKWSIQEVKSWITQKNIQLVFGVVILVKLHDVFVESMLQTYLINHLHLEVDTVGILYKSFGFAASVVGGLLGAWLLVRLGVYFMIGGAILLKLIAMMIFTFTIYSTQENMLALTALAITIESFASGWTATVVVVLMSRICQKAYAASQYAFLTSLVFALKVGIGPLAASVVYAYGWDGFFVFSVLSLAPPCLLLATKRIRDAIVVYGVVEEG